MRLEGGCERVVGPAVGGSSDGNAAPQDGLTGVPRYGWGAQGQITVSLRAAAAEGPTRQTHCVLFPLLQRSAPSSSVPVALVPLSRLPQLRSACSSPPVRESVESLSYPTDSRVRTCRVGPPNKYLLPTHWTCAFLRSPDARTPFSYQIVYPGFCRLLVCIVALQSLLYRLHSPGRTARRHGN